MKKGIIFGLSVIVCVYAIGVLAFHYLTYPNTVVNGQSEGLKPVDSIFEFNNDFVITVLGKDDKKIEINAKDIDLDRQYEKETRITQNSLAWPVEIFQGHEIDNPMKNTWNHDKLVAIVEKSPMYQKGKESQDATLEVKDGYFEIKEEVVGDKFDLNKAIARIESGMKNKELEIQLKNEDYPQPKILASQINQHKDVIDKINKMKIVLQMPDGEVPMGPPANYFELKGTEPVRITGTVRKFVEDLAEKYNTVGKARTFNATGIGEMTISGGIYGDAIDVGATIELLDETMKKYESLTTEPVYSQKAVPGDGIGNTYVEVDIGRQQMWFYRDGELVVSTPVVTGTPNGHHNTPTGIYRIWVKQTKRNLEGFNLDGTKYKVPVDYWMQVDYTGVGIHDTQTRAYYGGDIYRYAGSHGCINTPYGAVQQIYEMAPYGTPVVIYNSYS